MAQQFPCQVCGEQPDADFMVTVRNAGLDLPPGTTVPICRGCLIGLCLSWAQTEIEAAEAQADPEAVPPAEAAEADPGPQPSPKRRARRDPSPEAQPDPPAEVSDASAEL